MSFSLAKNTKLIRVENAAAAGTSDLTSDAIDTAGFEGCALFFAFGTITSGAVTSCKVQQSTASDLSGAADLEGSAVTVADTDDNKIVMIDIKHPRERYLCGIIDRGTQNAVVDGIWALLYNPRVAPTTHDSTTVVTPELHISPAEGTA